MAEDLAAVLHADRLVELADASQPLALEDVERMDRVFEGLDLLPLGGDWLAIDLELAWPSLDDVLGTGISAGFRMPCRRSASSSRTPFTRGWLCVSAACRDSLQLHLHVLGAAVGENLDGYGAVVAARTCEALPLVFGNEHLAHVALANVQRIQQGA